MMMLKLNQKQISRHIYIFKNYLYKLNEIYTYLYKKLNNMYVYLEVMYTQQTFCR